MGRLFDEADRRDPEYKRKWVGLVDGNNHQIDRIGAEATARGIDLAILIHVVQVIDYFWGPAWCFFYEGDTAAEDWGRDRALAVLEEHAREEPQQQGPLPQLSRSAFFRGGLSRPA